MPDNSNDVIEIGGYRTSSRFVRMFRSRFFLVVVLPLLAFAAAVKLLMLLCLVYVAPNEFGIKVVRVPLLSKRGVHEDVYQTGFHIVLRTLGVEEMYLFPKDVQ